MGTFNLKNNNFLPYVKFNCKEGTVERSTFDGNERGTEVVENFAALFDFDTLTTGWIKYDTEATDMHLVALGDPLPDRPGSDYKQGIKVIVMLPKGLGLHELSTTAMAATTALETIYDQAVSSPEWAQGKIPLVKLVSWTREKNKHRSRAVPNFEIADWKNRPEAFLEYKAIPKERASMPSGKATDTGTKPAATGSKPIKSPSSSPPSIGKAEADPDDFDPDDFG
jgi:hypothetical protein